MVSSGVRFGLNCRAPHGFVKPHHRGAGSGLAITVAVVTRTQSWFVGTLAVYAATWVWSWSRLPQRVPTHFGADGQVDQWSSRGSALLLTALLGVGATAFFVAVTAMVNHGRPSLVNIPNAHYWSQPAHLARMRQLVTEDLWLFGAWTVLLLTSIEVAIVRAARRRHVQALHLAMGVGLPRGLRRRRRSQDLVHVPPPLRRSSPSVRLSGRGVNPVVHRAPGMRRGRGHGRLSRSCSP